MSNELWIAVIGGICSLIGSALGVIGSAKLLTYRITQLEEKMKKQCDNCAVMDGRVDKLEKDQAVMKERINAVDNRVENLEKKEGIKS